ncbi:hypothetical protein EVAR_19207_1 [Eumeta japonica]|uniref:Uncharacterized protein n=1 Tax=Eumeta variegata TaxID=151549 RepID=A0A4C1VD69_EUMVA|nr:hypothetical protein EVAR_19207_1 [Eumeta japonica]
MLTRGRGETWNENRSTLEKDDDTNPGRAKNEHERHRHATKVELRAGRLQSLLIDVSPEGFLRLNSRIDATEDVSATTKAPPVIDGDHPYNRLYVNATRVRLHHDDVEITANELRQHHQHGH